MAAQTVVVLGGGVGGLVVANELRKKLGEEHRVVLVDREGRHIFTPSFLWLMTGDRRPEKSVRDLAPLERKGIEVVKGGKVLHRVVPLVVETSHLTEVKWVHQRAAPIQVHHTAPPGRGVDT